jgi:hypothetical protein
VDDRVSIGYLLSYYYDNGSHAGWACAVPAPWWTQGCYPHNGDSEAIFLHVEFNEATSHWVLAVAFYSQHEGYGVYGRGTNAYPTALFYPGALGGHPRAYVAQGKHANYSTISECNSGGALGTDVCYDVNAGARVAAASFLNLGSRANHTSAQDCMPSSNPSYQYYGSGRLECYWTNQPFRGWIPLSVGGEDSDGYSDRLADMGF